MNKRITYIDPVTGREIIVYPEPEINVPQQPLPQYPPTVQQQQWHPPPAPYYPQQMTPQMYERRSERKGNVAMAAMGFFFGGWILCVIDPTLTIASWALGACYLVRVAVKGA